MPPCTSMIVVTHATGKGMRVRALSTGTERMRVHAIANNIDGHGMRMPSGVIRGATVVSAATYSLITATRVWAIIRSLLHVIPVTVAMTPGIPRGAGSGMNVSTVAVGCAGMGMGSARAGGACGQTNESINHRNRRSKMTQDDEQQQ